MRRYKGPNVPIRAYGWVCVIIVTRGKVLEYIFRYIPEASHGGDQRPSEHVHHYPTWTAILT